VNTKSKLQKLHRALTASKMKIIICGNYGAGNLGDELILKGILKMLNEKLSKHIAEITVLSASPKLTKKLHGVDAVKKIPAGFRSFIKGILTLSFFRTLSVIKKCDLFILGGGSLFDDTFPRASFIWGIQVLAAYIYKKPVYIFANGFGPLNTLTGKLITHLVCDYAKFISVRDEASVELLRELGIRKKITVAADPVFMLEKKDLCGHKQNGQKSNHKYIIFVLRNENSSIQTFSKIFDIIYKKYGFHIYLIPFTKQDENIFAQNKLLDKKFVHTVPYSLNFCAVYNLFKKAEMIVSARLHPIILSIIAVRPFIAISKFDKIKNLLQSAKLEDLFLNPRDKNFTKNFKSTFESVIKNKTNYTLRIVSSKADFQHKSDKNKNPLTNMLKTL